MATNRNLRSELLKKLGISPQAVWQRVQRKKSQAPMSTEDATYLIAHEAGIRIDKFLSAEQVDKVRSLHAGLQHHSNAPVVAKTSRPQPPRREQREIRFPDNFVVADILLSSAKLNEARQMAAIYPLYVLENSMREVITRVMTAKFGADWWDAQLNSGKLKNVHQTAADRMKTETTRLRWHQTRGAHPIDYVDLGDLGTIILGKQDLFFPDVLGSDRDWFVQFMKELEPSRNVVCHMNPLSVHNIADIKLRCKKWETLLKNSRSHIPPAAAA